MFLCDVIAANTQHHFYYFTSKLQTCPYFQAHEFDPCRFDVAVNDCAWYLRADTPEEKEQWLEALTASKVCSFIIALYSHLY